MQRPSLDNEDYKNKYCVGLKEGNPVKELIRYALTLESVIEERQEEIEEYESEIEDLKDERDRLEDKFEELEAK